MDSEVKSEGLSPPSNGNSSLFPKIWISEVSIIETSLVRNHFAGSAKDAGVTLHTDGILGTMVHLL